MTKKRVAELEISVESIIETVREPLLVLDSDLRVIKANCSFYNFFKITPGETIGNFIYDLGNRQWDIPKLRTLLEDILPKDNNFDDYEVEHEFSNIGHKIMLFNARQITISSRIILLAIEDITERKQAGKVVHQTHDELQQLAVELTKGLRQAQADIIKNKRMENKLRESEERYRRIAEELTDYLYTVYVQDGQAVEVQHNEACEMLTGYTANEFAADPDLWIRIVVAQERDQAIEQVQKVLAGETVPPIEHHIVRKDGQIRWVSETAIQKFDSQMKLIAYDGVVKDITVRKAADEKLKQDAEKFRKSLIGTINALSMTVEARDPYTSGHQKKVSRLARAIAQDMALPNDTIDNIRMAGIIHDIGKISVPAEILSKTSKLTDMEFSLIKIHSQSGYDILKDAELPHPIAEIVLQHHERLDGSGYSHGLKDGQIILEARIVAVADVVEAMSSHRPYRPALGIEAALEEIEKHKGILYDKKVVEVCSQLFKEKEFRFE